MLIKEPRKLSSKPHKRRMTHLYIEPYEVNARLKSLGLTQSPLIDAVKQGELQRRLGSVLDPKPSPGYAAWSRAVRALREDLLEIGGWHPEDSDGVPKVVNDRETIAIAVTSGDQNTGDATSNEDPATKNPKGEATADAVKNNLPTLLDELDTVAPITWFLLYNSRADGLFAELSCPREMAANGYVSTWTERIVLGKIDLGEDAVAAIPAQPESSAPIDVTVIRRSS